MHALATVRTHLGQFQGASFKRGAPGGIQGHGHENMYGEVAIHVLELAHTAVEPGSAARVCGFLVVIERRRW
jgi:hypothetical protein